MAVVQLRASHPHTEDVDGVLIAPGETRNIDVSGPRAVELLASQALVMIDPDAVPVPPGLSRVIVQALVPWSTDPVPFVIDLTSAQPGQAVGVDGLPLDVLAEFLTRTEFTQATGGSPKFVVPAGSPGLRSDEFGNVHFALDFLVPDPVPGSFQQVVADCMWDGKLLRVFFRGGVISEMNDPADLAFRTYGGGHPYAGGKGAADTVSGSAVLTVTEIFGDDQMIFRAGRRIIAAASAGIPDEATILSATAVLSGTFTTGEDVATVDGATSDWEGKAVTSPSLPPGTVIDEVDVDLAEVTFSAAATATGEATLTVLALEELSTTGTLTISAPVTVTGSANVFSIGWSTDLTARGNGSASGQMRVTPPIARYGGDQTTPNAYAPATGGSIGWLNAEQPRDLTGHEDPAVGTKLRFAVVPKGRGTLEQVLALSSEGKTQVGIGAVAAGDNGAILQVRGYAGRNEKQRIQISGTAPTGGVVRLGWQGEPPTDGESFHGDGEWGGTSDGEPTADIPFNATAAQARDAVADAAGLAHGDITATGGPLPAHIDLEWTGDACKLRNFTRMWRDGSDLVGGQIVVARLVDGIPSTKDVPLATFRRESTDPTEAYWRAEESNGAVVAELDEFGRIVATGAILAGLELTEEGGALEVDGTAIVLTDDARLGVASDNNRQQLALAEMGLLSEVFDPDHENATATLPSGTAFGSGMRHALVAGDIVTGVAVGVGTAAVGTPPTLFKVGVQRASDNKIVAVSTNQAALLTVAGKRVIPVAYTVPPGGDGFYRAVILQVGTWTGGGAVQPAFAARTSVSSSSANPVPGHAIKSGQHTGLTDLAVDDVLALSVSGTTYYMGATR